MAGLSNFDRGVIVGLLLADGSFGGDGRQPHVILRMHVRHETLLRWLVARLPKSRLYGPYRHGGRAYYQWMARGQALVAELLPLLEEQLHPELDAYTTARIAHMKTRYAAFIDRERHRPAVEGSPG